MEELAKRTGCYEEIYYLDDNSGQREKNIRVIGGSEYVIEHKEEYDIIVAIGNAKARKQIQERYEQMRVYRDCIKRLIDIVLSAIALIVLSPILLVVSVLVRIRLGSPVIFKQKRPGKDGEIFELYKFRTMTDKRDAEGNLLPDEERLTKFGKKLRSTSLDELPELWNILKGDMSIVGPRPLLVQYLPLYNERQKHRHDVKPGLTGLAQVHGRNSVSWEEKFEWDVKYAKRVSLLMDFCIVCKTIEIVLKKEGINSDTSVTMEAFEGNSKEKGLQG